MAATNTQYKAMVTGRCYHQLIVLANHESAPTAGHRFESESLQNRTASHVVRALDARLVRRATRQNPTSMNNLLGELTDDRTERQPQPSASLAVTSSSTSSA